MDLSTILFTLLYGGAIVFILFFIYRLLRPSVSQKPTVVVYPVTTEVVYPQTSWWPWSISSYNAWPYWTGWWSGGGNGGYRYVHPHRGGYGRDRPWGTRPGPRSGVRGGASGGARGGASGGGR